MPAAITDLLVKQGDGTQPIPTQLTAEKAVGASTASLAAATGWDTTTAKHVRMYKTTVVSGQTIPDQSTISFYKATLSGTTLSNLTLIWSATGTDQKYDAGDTVDLAITSGWVDDIIEALLTEHNQDGTHKFGNYSTSETDTGLKWIDGKTIYKKTINFGALPNNTAKAVAHGISGTISVKNIYGIAISGTISVPLPYPHPTTTLMASLIRNGPNIEIQTGSDRSSYSAYVTVEYTR